MIRAVLQIDKAIYTPTGSLSSKPVNVLMLIFTFFCID